MSYRFVSDRYRPLYEAIAAYELARLKGNLGVWELAALGRAIRNAATVQVIIEMAQELESKENHILEMGERD